MTAELATGQFSEDGTYSSADTILRRQVAAHLIETKEQP